MGETHAEHKQDPGLNLCLHQKNYFWTDVKI